MNLKKLSAADTGIKALPLLNQPGLPVNKNIFDRGASKLVVQPHDVATGVQGSSGATTDSVNTFQGQPTPKMTSTGSNAFINFDLGSSVDLSGYDYVDLYMYIDNIPQISVIQVEFSNYANMADSFRINSTSTWNITDDPGWRYYRIPIANVVYNVGTSPSPASAWTGIRYFKVTVRSNSGTTVNVNIGKAEMCLRTSKGKLYLFFDDGYDNQYTKGYTIAKQYGIKGTIAAITSLVGTVGSNTYVTWPQLQDMKANGWLVVSHTHNHINLATTDAATINADLALSTATLRANGFLFGSRCLVAPNGGWSNTADEICRNYFSICRTGSYGIGVHTMELMFHPRIQRYISPGNTDSAASVQSWIDELVSNHLETVLAFHQVQDTNPTNDPYTYLTSDFTTIMQYIQSKVNAGLIDVVTWQDSMMQTSALTPVDSSGKQYLTTLNGAISVVQT